MTNLSLPDELARVSRLQFTLQSLTAQSARSAFNGYWFTTGPIAEYWRVSLQITIGNADLYRPLRALMFSLRGGRNKLRLWDASSDPMRGAGALGPTINIGSDAGAGAESLSVTGLIVSQAVALAADDKIGIGENLYTVVSDAGSDSSGDATISILPALRRGVAAGDVINLLRPTGLFRLMSVPDMTIVPAQVSEAFSIDLMEDPDLG